MAAARGRAGGHPRLPVLAAVAMVMSCGLAAAQTRPPDGGLLNREERPPLPPPQRPQQIDKAAMGGASGMPMKGADRAVRIQRVFVEGSTLIQQAAWDQRFSPLWGQSLTLPEMRQLAMQVQLAVQAAGRPYALAYLPPQDLSTEQLTIRVVEGRYGEVRAEGALADEAAPWLRPLQPGTPIGVELERQVQVLSELPGVSASATVSPGRGAGEGDVVVAVEPARRWGGDLRLDNHGNKYAGRYRLVGSVYVDRLPTLGDRLAVTGGGSDGGGLQGSLSYGIPLNARGARLTASVTHSTYELGKEFSVLEAKGRVTGVGATLTVPLTLSSRQRVTWVSGLQRQKITDEQRLFGIENTRRSESWTNALQGAYWSRSGGVVWGQVSAEAGQLTLRDDASRAFDAQTARTAGGFLLLNADASVLQPMGAWTGYARLSVQLANSNLDSSKKMVLGGAGGVRAWPTSEGAGDDGALAQLELRRPMGAYSPFVFLDAGRVQTNHRPWETGSNSRSLVGTGFGLRWAQGPWQFQGTAGWRLGPDRHRPQADSGAGSPQVWVSLGYSL